MWHGRPDFLPTRAYDDHDFTALLAQAAELTQISVDELLRQFGAFAAEQTFAQLYPAFYEESGSARTFLLNVEEHIHELVRATVPGAAPPKLHVRPLGRQGVIVSYTSERGLCRMLEGLLQGTANHFGEQLAIEQIQCLHEGDPGCVFTVQPSPDAPSR